MDRQTNIAGSHSHVDYEKTDLTELGNRVVVSKGSG